MSNMNGLTTFILSKVFQSKGFWASMPALLKRNALFGLIAIVRRD